MKYIRKYILAYVCVCIRALSFLLTYSYLLAELFGIYNLYTYDKEWVLTFAKLRKKFAYNFGPTDAELHILCIYIHTYIHCISLQ